MVMDPFEEAAMELGCEVDELLGTFAPRVITAIQRAHSEDDG